MRGRMSWGAHIQLTHCCLGCLVHGRPPDSSLFVPESAYCSVPRSWLHSGLVSSSPPPNIGCIGGGGSLADTLGWGLSPHLIAMWCEKWITKSRRWPWVTLCVSPASCGTAVASIISLKRPISLLGLETLGAVSSLLETSHSQSYFLVTGKKATKNKTKPPKTEWKLSNECILKFPERVPSSHLLCIFLRWILVKLSKCTNAFHPRGFPRSEQS